MDSGKIKEIVKIISIKKLTQSPFQGRLLDINNKVKEIHLQNEIDDLAKSIEQSGLMQPIVVRQLNDTYEIIDGHRRVMAIRQLGRGQVEAIIKSCDEREAQILSVIGNLQRKNLNPIEQAIAFKKLLDKKIFKDKRELSKAIGKDETFVGDLLNTLQMDPRIVDDLAHKNLVKDLRILRLIRKAGNIDKQGVSNEQWELYRKVIWQKLSRNQVRDLLRKKDSEKRIKNYNIKTTAKGITLRIETTGMSKAAREEIAGWLEEKMNELVQK